MAVARTSLQTHPHVPLLLIYYYLYFISVAPVQGEEMYLFLQIFTTQYCSR